MTFRPTSSKQKALNAAEKVFKGLDNPKPLKYQQIAVLAGVEGWSHAGKENSEITMYYALKHAIDKGDKTFKFHGRGYFSLTEHNINDYDVPEYSVIKRLGRKKRQDVFGEVINKTCGNCHYMKYTGIKEVTQESGICSHKNVGRVRVTREMQPCERWELCSQKKLRKEAERKIDLTITLEMIRQNKQRQPRKRKGEV